MRDFGNREMFARLFASTLRHSGPLQFQSRRCQKVVVGYLDSPRNVPAEKILEAFAGNFFDTCANPVAVVVELAFLGILVVHAPEHVVE